MPIPMPKLNHETIMLATIVVIGLAVLLQTVMLLAISIAVRKAAAPFGKRQESALLGHACHLRHAENAFQRARHPRWRAGFSCQRTGSS